MFTKVVVANRGAVAARVIRALHALQVKTVAVYSEADASAPYLELADEAYPIGPAPAPESYLNQDALLEVVKRSGADGVHPGYGFLAENPKFATRVNRTGAHFIGPSPRHIRDMGNKARARDIFASRGLPVGAGSDVLGDDDEEILAQARAVGYPLLIKPADGGGGIGMLPVQQEGEVLAAVERARSMAMRSFASSEVYLERLLQRPRHIEFQVLADRHGDVRHLFERDCSVQRRSQKIIEEAPAPALARHVVEPLASTVCTALRGLGYDNIGTVETLMGRDQTFSVLEMNTRLQVEHAVTEAVTGVDLVVAQIRAAAGERLDDILPPTLELDGHAIEVRIYAEDPTRFIPSPGKLEVFRLETTVDVRVETGYAEGLDVTPYYDPLIAKVIAHGDTREKALSTLLRALDDFEIKGLRTNIPFLIRALEAEAFRAPNLHTGFVQELPA